MTQACFSHLLNVLAVEARNKTMTGKDFGRTRLPSVWKGGRKEKKSDKQSWDCA